MQRKSEMLPSARPVNVGPNSKIVVVCACLRQHIERFSVGTFGSSGRYHAERTSGISDTPECLSPALKWHLSGRGVGEACPLGVFHPPSGFHWEKRHAFISIILLMQPGHLEAVFPPEKKTTQRIGTIEHKGCTNTNRRRRPKPSTFLGLVY